MRASSYLLLLQLHLSPQLFSSFGDLGAISKIARQLLYVAIFSMIMGGTILSISDKPVGQRAMFGAIAGALIGCAASVIVPLTYQSKVEAQTLPSAGGGAERQQGTFLRIGPNASIGNLHVYGNSVYGSTAMMDLQGRINNADVHDNLASLSLPPPVLIQGMTNLSTDLAENLKSSVATLCDELRSEKDRTKYGELFKDKVYSAQTELLRRISKKDGKLEIPNSVFFGYVYAQTLKFAGYEPLTEIANYLQYLAAKI